jgi:hypothetical protein
MMKQVWHDLLFAHWPLPPEQVSKVIPEQLPLDTFAGKAWVGIVPFHMSGVRQRFVPPLPGVSSFPELNVRTYVTLHNQPGVYFFSLDAANLSAVWAARAFYKLPYFHARMQVCTDTEIRYHSVRLHPPRPAVFRGCYRPVADIELRPPGSLEHWLTERYCLYTVAHGKVFRGEIHHLQWPLQNAKAAIEENSMAAPAGLLLPQMDPLCHFARRLEVLIWPLRPCPLQAAHTLQK